MAKRLIQLYTGLILYGVSIAIFVRAGLGLDPWDVFHMGLALLTGLKIGQVIILVGVLVLLLWIPMRQKPGLGTLSNVIVLGLVADGVLAVFPPPHSLMIRSGCLVAAIIINAIATSMYIGAGFGAGPRDGLMTGLHTRTGWPVRRIRTCIELTVLFSGWLMGGSVGVGTVLYALAIGPLIQLTLPWFAPRRSGRKSKSVTPDVTENSERQSAADLRAEV